MEQMSEELQHEAMVDQQVAAEELASAMEQPAPTGVQQPELAPQPEPPTGERP